jgi:2-aminoethylphosphonate-pyruvate transaminase
MTAPLPSPPGWKDKALYTPGPLTTSRTVKQAMLRDLGSRDTEFIETVRYVRAALLQLAGVAGKGYECVLMQGSGTFAIESVLSSVTPPDGHWLIVINGAYGRRMVEINRVLKIATTALEGPEHEPPDPAAVDAALAGDPSISHVAVVHCETTTGIFNPVEAIGRVVRQRGRCYFVDAMSSFGAVPLDLGSAAVDYLVSSANKCVEGVPGFAFALARREALLATAGYARSLSLDLLAQWKGLEANGQFRFTPPTHALLAYAQALRELEAEGGVPGRAARYRANYDIVAAGMRELGFREYLQPQHHGYIINSYLYPAHPRFVFEEFYRRLSDKGFVIYPGKLSHADCFRIGNIGRLFPADMHAILAAIRETLAEMGVELRD